MSHFADDLVKKIADLSNPTVVGLDPHFDKIPSFIKEDAVRKYGKTREAAAIAPATVPCGPRSRPCLA